eukprot:5871016-Pyramimonas_sp.AAC.1
MADPNEDMDALMKKMERLQTEIDAANGWEIERIKERAMDALRCPPPDGTHTHTHSELLYITAVGVPK